MRLPTPALLALLGALLALGWASFLATPHVRGVRTFVDRLEETLVDLRLLASGPLDLRGGPVVIVAIDERTFDRADFAFPLGRADLARLVERVAAAAPRVLALDVMLAERSDASGDAALREALSHAPAVIAAAGKFAAQRSARPVPRTSSLIWPERFDEAARVGLVNVVIGGTGAPRHLPLVFATERGPQAHLVLQAASLYADEPPRIGLDRVTLGERSIPLDLGYHLPLRLAGPRGTVPTVSAADVLAGTAGEALAGKAVVIGVTAPAVGDVFATPFDPTVPGVEVVAAGLAQMLGGSGLRRTREMRWADALAAAGIALGSALALALAPLMVGAMVASALLLTWLAAVGVLFAAGLWFNAALALAICVPVACVVALLRHLHERRLARTADRAARSLGRLQSQALAERVAKDPDFLAKPQPQVMAVLFVDLSGFTGTSERLGLVGTEALLKAFHGTVVDVVEARSGIVLNFLGDGVLAAFGLLAPGGQPADDAFAAAFDLVATLETMPPPAAGMPKLAARVGVHYGTVLVSRLGHARQEQITISGDVVNLASRLLELCKSHGATIAMTAEVIEACRSADSVSADQVAEVAVRGRQEGARVLLWRHPAPAEADGQIELAQPGGR